MRIALVSQEYPPQTGAGGIGSQAFQKAHGLAARGHEVHVISHSTDERRHEFMQDQVHVIRIPGFDDELPIATDAVRWLTYSVRVAAEIARLHAEVNLELAEFPEWGSEAYMFAPCGCSLFVQPMFGRLVRHSLRSRFSSNSDSARGCRYTNLSTTARSEREAADNSLRW
jgi:hypothetical protein